MFVGSCLLLQDATNNAKTICENVQPTAQRRYVQGKVEKKIAENSCIGYVDSVNGANEGYWEDKTAIIPDWCEFVETE